MSARTVILFIGAFLLAQANHVGLLIIGLFLAGSAVVSIWMDKRGPLG